MALLYFFAALLCFGAEEAVGVVEVIDVQIVDPLDREVGAPVHVVAWFVAVPTVWIVGVPCGPASSASSSSSPASTAAVLYKRHSLPGIVPRSLYTEACLVVVQEARGLDHCLWIIILALRHIVG